MDLESYQILYEFGFDDGVKKHFTIVIDAHTLTTMRPGTSKNPRWTRLTYKKCRICPLDETRHPHCPIAVNISDIVHSFKYMLSFRDSMVRCITPERIYLKKTSVMEGISSIFGLIMATSNCPIMDFLKPMARFHLPFASLEETMVRVTSMYLLRQYFLNQENDRAILDLHQLHEHYQNVQAVNEGLLERINGWIQRDANKNALIILHSLSKLLSMEIRVNLDSIKPLFTMTDDGSVPDMFF